MITIRPYHLFAIIRQLATGPTAEDEMFRGVPIVTQRILANPDEEIKLVEEFDDCCVHCTRRAYDPAGSIWAEKHSCPSALRPERAYMVGKDYERILRKLDCEWGDTKPAREFLKLAAEKYPDKYGDKPDSDYRKWYLQGIEKLKELGWL